MFEGNELLRRSSNVQIVREVVHEEGRRVHGEERQVKGRGGHFQEEDPGLGSVSVRQEALEVTSVLHR